MRSARFSGRAVLAAAALLWLVLGAQPAAAASCTGNACGVAMVSADGCAITNNGTRPFAVTAVAGGSTAGLPSVAPGGSGPLRLMIGCPVPSQTSYTVNFVGDPPGTQVTTIFVIGGCQGNACADVSLKLNGKCVWARNTGAKAVAAQFKLASQTISLALLAPDPAKAITQSTTVSSPNAATRPSVDPAQCASAMNSEKMLEEDRAKGDQVPPTPELDAILAKCRAASAPAPAATVASSATAYSVKEADPLAFGSNERVVYTAMLQTASGCVANVSDVLGYTANYNTP